MTRPVHGYVRRRMYRLAWRSTQQQIRWSVGGVTWFSAQWRIEYLVDAQVHQLVLRCLLQHGAT